MPYANKLHEITPAFNVKSKIVSVVEQPIKFTNAGRINMVNTLGIVLEKTIFYPQGSGVPSDKGSINDVEVLLVNLDQGAANNSKGPTIYHFLNPKQIRNKQFRIGQKVEVKVDPDFRWRCQRSHTLGHLLVDLFEFNQKLKHYKAKVTRMYHYPGNEYIKVLIKTTVIDENMLITLINEELQRLVQGGLEIRTIKEGNRQQIKIGDVIRECKAAHVQTTSDLNNCYVKKLNISPVNIDDTFEVTIFYEFI